MEIWQNGNFKNLRGNANKINVQLFLGVGGRGLCVGAAQNNAGKTALSRNGTVKKSAKCNGVIFLPV
jgi:hypothetical protein